jgi:hypothetical protein
MPDEVNADRVAALSNAARVPLKPETCDRVALAIGPTVARFAALNLVIGFEVEPASFAAIARQEIRKEVGK